MGRNRATMKEVAAEAGVSVFTVSGVINNSPRVGAETRRRVLEAIQRTGYVPNASARSLRTQRSLTVGVQLPFFRTHTSREFFSALAQGIHDELRLNGYHFVLSCVDDSEEAELRAINDLIAKGVDGLIIAPEFGSSLSSTTDHVPMVLVDRDAPHLDCDRVMNQNFESTVDAVTYLIERGHSRIGYVGLLAGHTNHSERYAGYRAALESNGLPFDGSLVVPHDKGTFNASRFGYEACSTLLDRSVSAIFCNETFATIGIIKCLRQRDISMPGKIALITYDDHEWQEFIDPPLTAVRQDPHLLGETAARVLLARMSAPKDPFQNLRLPATLVHRGSA